MMFVPCYSDSEAKRLLETLSFVQGKRNEAHALHALSGEVSKAIEAALKETLAQQRVRDGRAQQSKWIVGYARKQSKKAVKPSSLLETIAVVGNQLRAF